MESLELRIFREVANTKSISKAAKNLGYVQSNVTHQIRKLESEINCDLLTRSNKGVDLTEEGLNLLKYANRITELLDTAMGTIIKPKNIIKIGASQTIASKKIPRLICNFSKRISDTDISITSYNQNELIESLMSEKIDCAFINSDSIYTTELTPHFSFSEKIILISNKEVHNTPPPKIIVSNSSNCPYRNFLFSWYYKKYDKEPDFIEFDTLQGVMDAVSLGLGISCVPEYALSPSDSLKKLFLNDYNTVNISLVTRQKELKPYIKEFINQIINENELINLHSQIDNNVITV